MCDFSKRKSPGYCRSKNTLRTVTTTKWELPIPGSKHYWDKICDELEQRKEHVSDFSYPPAPLSDVITDLNTILNSRENILSKSNYMVEPIVKISPPTPMRMAPQSCGLTITHDLTVNENSAYRENDDDDGSKNSNLSDNLRPVDVTRKKHANLPEMSICVTQISKNNECRTIKSCQLHKNTPPLKIFDDDLKRFLPKTKITQILPSAKVQRKLSDVSDLSQLHSNKFCPLRNRPIVKDRKKADLNLTKNKNRVPPSLKRSKTEDCSKIKLKKNSNHFLKVPEFSRVNLSLDSRYKTLDKKSKSKILMSNINHMLSIPKLNNFSSSKNVMFNDEAMADLNLQQQCETILDEYNASVNVSHSKEMEASQFETVKIHGSRFSQKPEVDSTDETVIPISMETLKPTSSSANSPRLSNQFLMALDRPENNKQTVDKTMISTEQSKHQLGKHFLKVPKLGAISSYPSFSRLTSEGSMEANECRKPIFHGVIGNIVSSNLERASQQTESCERNSLKVPKLSMMSSYPSFNSLIPESLDSDDNVTGPSELLLKRVGNETENDISTSSNLKSMQISPMSVNEISRSGKSDETPMNCNENSELRKTHDEEITSNVNYSRTAEKSRRRRSLKDSVRYAYRALKFLTPNKTLDFQPQSYHPAQKSNSSTESSRSSRGSTYPEFEPSIKLLTYQDIDKDRPPMRSVSSSTYETVRSRLKKSASHYLGSNYVFSSSKARPATPSTTIPSLTRSTSGPTLNFQEPILKKPSNEVLSRLPKMSIFPRRKHDKCFACLHKSFEKPVQLLRELPLATLNAVLKDSVPTISESESSSISLPDVKDFIESQSDDENDWTEVLGCTKKSSQLDKIERKSPRGLIRTNLEYYRSRQTIVRASEESQSLKSDGKIENLRKNLSSKDSIATNTNSKPLSVSSEHSKPSSISGHSSESDEPQAQMKETVATTSECFVSPCAPTHWAPSLEPLKSLKLRKPVSMHGRAISITKTEDDTSSDDDANKYRSTRKENQLKNTSDRTETDRNQDSGNTDSSLKSDIKFTEKPEIVKQASIVSKILTSQLSTVGNLNKKQSRVDLFSNNSKNVDQTTSSTDAGEEIPKDTLTESRIVGASSPDENTRISNDQYVEAGSVGTTMAMSPLPLITERSIENEKLMAEEDEEKSLKSITDTSTNFQVHELHVQESQDLTSHTRNICSDDTVIEILEKCVEENRKPFEMLEALCAFVTQNYPFNSKEVISNSEIAGKAEVAKNLIKLLINSKKYLNPDKFSPNLEFSSPQIPLCNPRQLRRVLPTRTYKLVARILGMPENPIEKLLDQKPDLRSGHEMQDPSKFRQTRKRGPDADSCDMIVHPPSPRAGRGSSIEENDFEYPKQSPYALFMNKPRRKAIKWRPLTERDMLGYDPEATLNMRATRITNQICEDFCKWLRGLGGGHSEDIDEEVLKDMFQIEFTAESCRTMQVLIKEIPMVPIAVALARNTPGAGELALTRRHLIRDGKIEKMPKKLIGFGSMLPQADRFIPPKNRVDEKWLQCENVPRDLETMKTVWKGITHLDSVNGFLAWVKAHAKVKPPRILTETNGRKRDSSLQPSTGESSGHIELEMDQIESLKVGDAE